MNSSRRQLLGIPFKSTTPLTKVCDTRTASPTTVAQSYKNGKYLTDVLTATSNEGKRHAVLFQITYNVPTNCTHILQIKIQSMSNPVNHFRRASLLVFSMNARVSFVSCNYNEITRTTQSTSMVQSVTNNSRQSTLS